MSDYAGLGVVGYTSAFMMARTQDVRQIPTPRPTTGGQNSRICRPIPIPISVVPIMNAAASFIEL